VSTPTIVILEDDPELQALLERGLAEEGFRASVVSTGGELLRRVEELELEPDAFIIDIGLPDADGRDVCQALRSRGVHAPVLFLTARESVAERISGFDAGGDDYVTKPFAFAELVARLHALLRRGGSDGAVEAVGLRLDPVTHTVAAGSKSTPVSPTEFRLLARLLARPGEAVRRRDLMRAAWPVGAIVRDNTLDAYIARLRRKLRELPDAPPIATVHGVGYRVG
jgi:two-component system response regulator MprA